MVRRSCLVVLALALAGCQPVKETAAPAAAEAGLNASWLAESTVLPIASEQSSFYVLVYRAGALARLGHNHVISAPSIEGNVYRHPDLGQSQFELTLSVAELVIDDPDLRAREGEGFESVPSEEDIAGTRRNMLGSALLNGERFPEIRVTGSDMKIEPDGTATLAATIAIKDNVINRVVPVTFTESGDRLTAAGELTLSHAELGLTPFSVMLGALQVGEEMTLKFRLVAER